MKSFAALLMTILASVLSFTFTSALAQGSYPTAPIRMVLGFPPGGATDALARLLSQRLATQMNANVLVDNKPGANGNIAAEFVAKSRPDGYSLLLHSSTLILGRALGERVGYDLIQDLAPVSLIATSPELLFVHPSVPANSVSEFIAYVRGNPNKLAYGSSGTGSTTHLAALLFLQLNGLTAVHVPYKGSPPVMLDLAGGRIHFTMQGVTSGLAMVKDKRLKVLAIASLARTSLLPDVPTLAETVMPGFEVGAWYGLMTRARTAPEIVKHLNAETVTALKDPDVKARLAQENADPIIATPEEFGAYIKSELERWTKVIKSADLKPE